ncbi:late competence development ComFB family protein [Oceanirhabdus sp. W0125-5]|uniref:late competence development ComFB family protein n=1 Tax=Oceanirhabdus sp. W0125-5 TaxID=2999116 RepID=UPI0022F2FE7D|nr:late competence development ComFB family protein [Oceanirhabdus sp. W0125-5]WBW96564.1 late competence development ComFB family protein [Oceanirhabdus sp. W0125-5]
MHKLKNYNEEIVEHLTPKILMEYDNICKCDKCILDVKAIALNSMPPKYIVTNKGELFTKLNAEFNNQQIIDTTRAITQAIELVREKPQHDFKFCKKDR